MEQQEAQRGGRSGAVDGLADQALTRGEEQPVGGEEAPAHRGGERDQREDTGREVERGAQTVAARHGEQRQENQHSDGQPALYVTARPLERGGR